jgi:hypothetical protein
VNTYTYEAWVDGAWVLWNTLIQDMPNDMLWGIACTSHNNAATAAGEVSELDVEIIPGEVTRSMDSYTYGAGQTVDVELDVRLDSPSTGTTVVETVPAGWAISNISNGGTAAAGTITWNLGDISESVTLTYTVTAGALAGNQTFGGTFTMSGLTFTTLGATIIEAEPPTQVFNGPLLSHHADIGSVCIPGEAGYDDATGTWTNAASGSDIWGASDNFHFAFAQTDLQNFTISGKLIFPRLGIADIGMPIDPWAKVGLMVRKNLSGGSANVMGILSADNGSRLQYRPMQGSESYTIDFGWKPFDWDVDDPLFAEVGEGYVRLTKMGNTFTMEYKEEPGDPWTFGTSFEVDLGPPPYYWGFGVTAHTPTEFEFCDPWLDWTFGDVQELTFEEGPVISEPPVITAIEKTAGGVQISWIGFDGANYGIQSKESWDGAWAEVDTMAGADGPMTWEDTDPLAATKFYQVTLK